MDREQTAGGSGVALRLGVAVTAAVILGAGLFAGAAAGIDDPVTLDITVLDRDGEPVSNAELTVVWADNQTVEETRANGRALVDVPAGADVEIRVDHPEYTRNRPFTVTDATSRAVEVPVALSGVAGLTVLEGEQPVPDTQLTVREPGGPVVAELTTGDDGTAETGRLEQGQYEVTTERPGYFDETVSLELDREQVERSIAVESGRVTVSFAVFDDHFDPPEPIEGATIETERTILETGSEGQRSVDLDVNTVQNVTVNRDGYVEVTRRLVVGETDRAFEITTQREPELELVSDQQRVIVGEQVRVTATNAYDEPVAGATILLNGEPVGETGANGQLLVEITETGQQTVRAEADLLRGEATIEGVDPDDSDTAGDDEPGGGDDSDAGSDDEPGGTDDGDANDGDDSGGTDDAADDDGSGPGFGLVAVAGAIAALVTAVRLRTTD